MKRLLSIAFRLLIFSSMFGASATYAQECPINVAGVPEFYTFTLGISGDYSAAQCLADYGAAITIDGAVYNQSNCFDPGDGWVAVYSKALTADATLPFTANFLFGSCDYDVSGILPVELAHFTGEANGVAVVLNWTTWSEWNNEGFEVQRMKEPLSGRTAGWSSLGFVPGSGFSSTTTTYTFLDPAPLPGRAYYRLKQLDVDGAFTYSGIIVVEGEMPISAAHWRLFPNPADATVTLQSDRSMVAEGAITYALYDALGRLVSTDHLPENGIIDLHGLSSGVYQLVLYQAKGQYVTRLVKR